MTVENTSGGGTPETNPSYTDQALLEKLAHGTEAERNQAAKEIDRRYGTELVHYAMKQGGAAREDAQDCVQKVLIKLCDMEEDCLKIKQLSNYLHTAVYNCVRNSHRRDDIADRKMQFLADTTIVRSSPSPAEEYEAKETLGILTKAMNSLQPRMRLAFILSVLKGLSNEEIAERMNVKPETVDRQVMFA